MSEAKKVMVLNTLPSGDDALPGGDAQPGGDTSQPSVGGVETSERLQKSMLKMTGKFLNESAGTVDYVALRKSQEFREYCALANHLKEVALSGFDRSELLAFFINVYNALTVHSICEIQRTSDIGTTLDVPNFWGSYAYEIGGSVFTLDDIEHGVLRGNRPHPSSGKPIMDAGDPRVQYSFKQVDPRIHFALNCGAKSCPMVRVYNSKNLEDALEGATKSYLSQEVHLEKKDGSLKIPQILEWYLKDFAENQSGMLKWIEPYVEPLARETINSLLAAQTEDGATSVLYFYDWSLNKA